MYVDWSQCLKYRAVTIMLSQFDSAEIKLTVMSSFSTVFQKILKYRKLQLMKRQLGHLWLSMPFWPGRNAETVQSSKQFLLTTLANNSPRCTKELKHTLRKMGSRSHQAHSTGAWQLEFPYLGSHSAVSYHASKQRQMECLEISGRTM